MPKGLSLQPRHAVALSMIATLMGTALVSPLYPLYQEEWGLSAGDISNIYVIYMMGALCGLLFLGRLGDRIGYGATLLSGLLLALVGTVICVMARDMVVLSIGRFMVGVAGTMATSSGAAGLMILTPENLKSNVALKISLLVAFGFGIGPVIGGVVGQWLPLPLATAHVPSLVMLLLGLVLVWALPGRMGLKQMPSVLSVGDFLPKLTWPQSPHQVTFGLACVLSFITFGMFGLNASMAPAIVRNVLGLGGPLVSGLGIAMILVGSCLTQIAFKRLNYTQSALIGLALLGLSNAIMAVNLHLGMTSMFALGLLATAMGHGFAMFAGSQIVNMIADNSNRSSLTASFWAVGYFGSIGPMMATGIMSDRWGMNFAVTTFCVSTFILCVIGAALFVAAHVAEGRQRDQDATASF